MKNRLDQIREIRYNENMKKVTLTDLNGKELEVFYADDKTAKSMSKSDNYNTKIEDAPTKHWAEMTGGTKELEESYEDESSDLSFMEQLQTSFLGKVKDLEQSGSQIKIDDTIPSDFVDLSELRNGSIYKVAGLNLLAKLVSKQFDDYSALLKMKRHGTVFYVEEGSLMKATDLEVELYLEESK